MPAEPTTGATIGELDLHLFNEGTHRRLWEVLGPQFVETGGVRFAVWAPNARGVRVVGDWNGWSGDVLAPVGSSGIWSSTVDAAGPGHHYKFDVTGVDGRTVRKADPMARRTELPPSDASIVPEPARHEWSDGEWMARRAAVRNGEAPLRIYEVHAG
jgi:1,4-alpha-glucan branching enzyme